LRLSRDRTLGPGSNPGYKTAALRRVIELF
jgi:hypothetical protein